MSDGGFNSQDGQPGDQQGGQQTPDYNFFQNTSNFFGGDQPGDQPGGQPGGQQGGQQGSLSDQTGPGLELESNGAKNFFFGGGQPSGQPQVSGVNTDSNQPSDQPSGQPSDQPSDQPSGQPSGQGDVEIPVVTGFFGGTELGTAPGNQTDTSDTAVSDGNDGGTPPTSGGFFSETNLSSDGSILASATPETTGAPGGNTGGFFTGTEIETPTVTAVD